ncbi:hypothetical protein Tco_1409939 [Tanacetum coccineum]
MRHLSGRNNGQLGYMDAIIPKHINKESGQSWRHPWDHDTTVFPNILTMTTNEQTPLSQPTSVVRNTLGKEPVPQDPGRPISDEALREYYYRNYHQILPIIAEKVHQEKAQQEKLKAVKDHLNFEETLHHSSQGHPSEERV